MRQPGTGSFTSIAPSMIDTTRSNVFASSRSDILMSPLLSAVRKRSLNSPADDGRSTFAICSIARARERPDDYMELFSACVGRNSNLCCHTPAPRRCPFEKQRMLARCVSPRRKPREHMRRISFLFKCRIDVVLRYPRLGIAWLIEILFFGAISQHAGVFVLPAAD